MALIAKKKKKSTIGQKFSEGDAILKERTELQRAEGEIAGLSKIRERERILSGEAAGHSVAFGTGGRTKTSKKLDIAETRADIAHEDIAFGEKQFAEKGKAKKKLRKKSGMGRSGTILTGTQGVKETLGSKRKTLLGG